MPKKPWSKDVWPLSELIGHCHAGVLGRIWSFCTMDGKCCYASMETIARTMGVDRITIWRAIFWLEQEGYIERKKHSLGETDDIRCTAKAAWWFGDDD